MNAEVDGVPGLEPKHDFALWSVIVLLIFAMPTIVAIVKFVWPRIRCRTQTQPVTRPARAIRLMPSRATMFAVLRESVWLLVPYVVALSFVITSDLRFRSRGLSANVTTPASSPSSPVAPQGMILRVEPGSDARVEAHRDSNGIQTTNITVSPSNAVPTSDASPHDTPAKAAPQRPAWVDQKRVIDGDCTRIVLTSQQYATKEEAEQELLVAVVKLVEQDLQRIQAGSFRPTTWQPAAADVIAHAVQQRYDEIADRDFGKFTHPMIRVSWQVELSPRVRTEFAPAWRRALISFRIMLVAAIAIDFTALATLSLMYFRIAARMRGQSREASLTAD
ncbi:MAG: hypothetical protein NTZ32_20365 [Planctomycetales bacterium]|nr:hypothetical protein [Planctomycetales bacterium]